MKFGRQTLLFDNVYLKEGAAVVGEKEGKGPLKDYFDLIIDDDKFGEESFEKAERKMLKKAYELVKDKASIENDGIDMVFGGDLLNQIISTSFATLDSEIPFFGVYGACSTICESILLASCMIEGNFARNVLCSASSHFSTAERQYRFPLEYGSQQTPTTQWTVTGAGCSLVSSQKSKIKIVGGTIGKLVDAGIKDANNMGAAMAPAAADTITSFLHETKTVPEDYDLILTGDLGVLGKELMVELMKQNGYNIYNVYNDCGCMIYYPRQNSPMGASGCGCASTVFNSCVMHDMLEGKVKNVLLAATGAMLSPVSSFQGENIPCISYALNFRRV